MVVEFVNYWKAGFSFGLFVDAFKVGSWIYQLLSSTWELGPQWESLYM
jgi:hypothetical protein